MTCRGGRIKPLLSNIRLFGVVTTYGSPWWPTRLVMQDPGRKVLFRALKPMCGPAVRSFYLAHYDMDRSTAASRKAFEERVRAKVSQLIGVSVQGLAWQREFGRRAAQFGQDFDRQDFDRLGL